MAEITSEYIRANDIQQFIYCFHKNILSNNINQYVCRVNSCKRSFPDNSNAIRHVRKSHTAVYNSIRDNKENNSQRKLLDEIYINVRINVEDIWKASTQLIITNGLPLSIVESPAFRRIIEPYVVALARKGIRMNITIKAIRKRIDERARSIREEIKKDVMKMPLALMIDIGSRYGRSIMGVSVAYNHDRTIRHRTLARV